MKKNFVVVVAILAFCHSALIFSADPRGKGSRRGGASSRGRLQKRLAEREKDYEIGFNEAHNPIDSADAVLNARNKRLIDFMNATGRGDWKTAFTILNNVRNNDEKRELLLAIDKNSRFNALFDAVTDASEKVVRSLVGLYRQLGINVRDMQVHGHSLLDAARMANEVKPRQPIIKFLEEELFYDEEMAAAAQEALFEAQAPATEEEIALMEQMMAGSQLGEEKEYN
ncbi:MAG TPA: hypothetical protein VGT41_03310 [Candidatus Babeliales bacterium]|nr:hypothetical protein [Candidatus Babeliales bacterium]